METYVERFVREQMKADAKTQKVQKAEKPEAVITKNETIIDSEVKEK